MRFFLLFVQGFKLMTRLRLNREGVDNFVFVRLVSCHVIDKILCDKVSEIESIYSEMNG